MTTTSRLVREFKSEPVNCPRCNQMPVQLHSALVSSDGSWGVGRLWFQCPTCGRRGGKAESHEESARLWNEKEKEK